MNKILENDDFPILDNIDDLNLSFLIADDITELISDEIEEILKADDCELMDIDNELMKFFKEEATSVQSQVNNQKIVIKIPQIEDIPENSIQIDLISTNKIETPIKSSQNFTCLLCKLNFPNRFNLDRHFTSQKHIRAENEFTVDHIEEDDFNEFIIEEIPDDLDVIELKNFCRECNLSFKNAYQLRKHSQNVHRIYKCEKCCRGFKSVKEFELHLERHVKSDEFRCESCGKIFTNNANLRRHEKLHLENAKKFECKICSKVFNQKTNLQRHLKVHDKNC